MMIKNSEEKIDFILQALALAEKRRGFCSPNPAVGALVVKDKNIIGRGIHWACGKPHAEVMALEEAGENAKGCELYVTLEPCCHFGRTPPCVNLIIKKGIRQVYYAMTDPNPKVLGKSFQLLNEAKVKIDFITVPQVVSFYESYSYWWQTAKPFVTFKLALSLDGKIAGKGRKRLQLTGVACQKLTHEWRKRSDALLTTAKTVLSDDPELNVRLDDEVISKKVYVLDRQLELSTSIKLLRTSAKLILLYDETTSSPKIAAWNNLGVECYPMPLSAPGELSWDAILKFIGEQGVHDLWVEAGSHCFQTLWQKRLINQLLLYLAPQVVGSNGLSAFSPDLQFCLSNDKNLIWQQYGPDVVLSWKKK